METFCNFMTLIMATNIIALCIWSYIRWEFINAGDFVMELTQLTQF
jgi:hypothetical protein